MKRPAGAGRREHLFTERFRGRGCDQPIAPGDSAAVSRHQAAHPAAACPAASGQALDPLGGLLRPDAVLEHALVMPTTAAHQAVVAVEAHTHDVRRVARVDLCRCVVNDAWVVEQLDTAVVVARHQQLLVMAAVQGVYVGAIGLRVPDAHNREAQHARVCVVVHVAKQLGVDDLRASACVPVQHLIVVRVGHERGGVVIPVDAAHRGTVASAACNLLVAVGDRVDVDPRVIRCDRHHGVVGRVLDVRDALLAILDLLEDLQVVLVQDAHHALRAAHSNVVRAIDRLVGERDGARLPVERQHVNHLVLVSIDQVQMARVGDRRKH
mmetsp:Transcript_2504/g.5808  ORF Transcript_2504/g.5808 Transcript_2504/m.5808 type:complete len:324 (+) Transcript_2504:231-1202(+)